MIKSYIFTSCFILFSTFMFSQTIAEKTASMTKHEGYFNFYWEAENGKIWLEIDKLDQEFLYVNSLATGVGSNDIGLDRGQLGGERIVKFTRIGSKVMMMQPNYKYRAISDNQDEVQSVKEAFAESILAGFHVSAEEGGSVLVDMTSFLMKDAHNVGKKLRNNGQGSYVIDALRSAIYMERTKSFPKNTEFEAILTFKGEAKGKNIRSVTPNASAVTVRQHHSFIQLPDDKFEARKFDPRSGYFYSSYYDYASPIGTPMEVQMINRHRLEKKDPTAKVSEPVEQIVYYLDRGTPEPVRSALLDGARWWNQAFEAAGYEDAFVVKIMPEGADMMDVRYNVIQWVHRSTRGWSYGASVSDPRTGEIIKGHVSLGSLRVRQDYLIAQGLLSPFENGTTPDPRMLEMALARLRQLAAHEVGHTLGLSHNFAASTNDRSSVMDYPHPYITLDKDGNFDFTKAYDDKIGAWDKRTILYGYQDFPNGTDEKQALNDILKENQKLGLRYLTDQDARPQGGAHPHAHLWDNGEHPVKELSRILEVRQKALENFGLNSIPEGAPMATLENVLAPIYLSHRYQVEAAVKVLGGVVYEYSMKGDGNESIKYISKHDQEQTLTALLRTVQPSQLSISDKILKLIPPQPQGYSRGRENFGSRTGLTFDYLAAAESSSNHTLALLFNTQRLGRIVQHHSLNTDQPSISEYLETIMKYTWGMRISPNAQYAELQRMVQQQVLYRLMQTAMNERASAQVRAMAFKELMDLEFDLNNKSKALFSNASKDTIGHYKWAMFQITQFKAHPDKVEIPKPARLPDGSPIGCGEVHN